MQHICSDCGLPIIGRPVRRKSGYFCIDCKEDQINDPPPKTLENPTSPNIAHRIMECLSSGRISLDSLSYRLSIPLEKLTPILMGMKKRGWIEYTPYSIELGGDLIRRFLQSGRVVGNGLDLSPLHGWERQEVEAFFAWMQADINGDIVLLKEPIDIFLSRGKAYKKPHKWVFSQKEIEHLSQVIELDPSNRVLVFFEAPVLYPILAGKCKIIHGFSESEYRALDQDRYDRIIILPPDDDETMLTSLDIGLKKLRYKGKLVLLSTKTIYGNLQRYIRDYKIETSLFPYIGHPKGSEGNLYLIEATRTS